MGKCFKNYCYDGGCGSTWKNTEQKLVFLLDLDGKLFFKHKHKQWKTSQEKDRDTKLHRNL